MKGLLVYDPPGPVSEAFASHYVRLLVQRAIDQAFRLSSPPAHADSGEQSD